MKKIAYFFRYWKMKRSISGTAIYDGRNRGVDVYVCKHCGNRIYTQYKDKGVTPFMMMCRKDGCLATAQHEHTIPSHLVPVGKRVLSWYRPSFKEMLTLNEAAIEHVLLGGLILEDKRGAI